MLLSYNLKCANNVLLCRSPIHKIKHNIKTKLCLCILWKSKHTKFSFKSFLYKVRVTRKTILRTLWALSQCSAAIKNACSDSMLYVSMCPTYWYKTVYLCNKYEKLWKQLVITWYKGNRTNLSEDKPLVIQAAENCSVVRYYQYVLKKKTSQM